jgi:putative hydrolase of the HAD superfamily
LEPGPGPAVEQPILLFDLGNILVRLHNVDRFWQGKEAEPGSIPYALRWGSSKAVWRLETGQIRDFVEFYREACSELGIILDQEEFYQEYLKIIGEPFEWTLPILNALYSRFSLQLLSNTSFYHWQHCSQTLGLGRFFDQIFVSYELGCMKPDPEIFQRALNEIGQSPETIYYFDDRPENVETATKFGINAHLSWGGMRLLNQLRALKFIR